MNENTNFPSQIKKNSSEGKPAIPQERIDAVINREQNKATEAGEKKADLQSTIDETQKEKIVDEERKDQVQSEANIRAQERDIQEKSLFGLGKLFGKREREEQQQADEAKLTAIRKELEHLDTSLEETQQAKDQAEKEQAHSETVAEANKLGGPTETSSKMIEALRKQDAVKFYTEARYPIDKVDYLMPMPVIDQLMQEMQKPELSREIQAVDTYYAIENVVAERRQKADLVTGMSADSEAFAKDQVWLKKNQETMRAEVMKLVIGMTPVYEEIVKLVDQENIPLSQNLLVRAMIEGLKITRGVNDEYVSEAWNFTKQKKGGNITALDVGYYAIGASQLDKFFKHRKNIQGRNQLPYILAYGAGVLSNRSVQQTSIHLRNWLAEAIPTPKSEQVRKNGEWVTEQSEPTPRGFGHMMQERDPYGFAISTSDEGWYQAIKEANKMSEAIFASLRQKRQFDAEKKFTSGMNYWEGQLFQEPKLINPKNSSADTMPY